MAEARGRPDEAGVRAVVRRIVDGLADAPAPSSSGASSAAVATVPPPPAVPAAPAPAPASRAAGPVRIAIGADHGGVALKGAIGKALADQGYDVQDCGTSGDAPVDYPDIALAVARLVADGSCSWGIVVDGAGIGSCMAANKVPGVRAALCYDLSTARNSREHNHANVLTLGARLVGTGLALDIVTTWLATPWGPGRHAARVAKITEIERRYLRDGAGETR